jgi:hypothetical protein
MEQIRISKTTGQNGWRASVGQVTLDMLSKKNFNGDIQSKILDQSIAILESCGNPENLVNDDTGLVIGYVQSGKTLSFTTVSALAAQNGFNVIIIIAGTTTALVDQTYSRLADDLDINVSKEVSWKTYKNPTIKEKNEIIADLEPGILNRNPVLLITVMKNATHLKNLNHLFKSVVDANTCKVLIIDDEADQASLNTKASKGNELDVSRIYELVRGLKRTFENHTYLQYTATPQGPLFISLLDILSPNFVKVLEPGDQYTGGKTFFWRNNLSKYPHVFDIPEDEIYTKDRQVSTIPKSLVEATMFYYLTVVIGALNGETPQSHNRTMMVHPSQFQLIHSVYQSWLVRLKKRLLEELLLRDNDPDKITLIDDFHEIFKEIPSDNTQNFPSFDDVIQQLPYVIRITPIFLSNSSVKNKINFKKYYSMILVGGQVLDRGFTVEGLNVTYMPRSIGVGNADTLQQRCRFFGYKKNYIDLCRIYLPRKSKRAYIDYVTHEEDMRKKLKDIDGSKSLKEFKRIFILSPDLNITRRNIISDDLNRYRLEGWRSIQFIDPNYRSNNLFYQKFISGIEFEDLPTDPNATEFQKHEFAIIPALDLVDDLLISLQHINAANTLLVNHLLSLLGILIENDESQKIHVVHMSKGLARSRSADDENKLKSLLQGANPKTNYPGDRSIKSNEYITIQIHNIDVKNKNKSFRTIAIHFPDNFAQHFIALDH